jgi:hypothetical protein
MGDLTKLHLKRAKLKIEWTDSREKSEAIIGGLMAIFESLANSLKILAIGDRVKVTLRPETGRFPNPMEGRITRKDDSGNFSIESEQGIVQVSTGDILSITKLSR